MDGAGSWWADHWSEVVAVALASGFLMLVGAAVRSSLMLGQSAVNRRVRHRRASDAAAAGADGGGEWRTAFHRLEQRVAALEAAVAAAEGADGEEIESNDRSVLARLSSETPDVRAEVERLARDGRSIEEIAQTLGEPAGRVELILNLRRASGQS